MEHAMSERRVMLVLASAAIVAGGAASLVDETATWVLDGAGAAAQIVSVLASPST
jgi:hypothetical protein